MIFQLQIFNLLHNCKFNWSWKLAILFFFLFFSALLPASLYIYLGHNTHYCLVEYIIYTTRAGHVDKFRERIVHVFCTHSYLSNIYNLNLFWSSLVRTTLRVYLKSYPNKICTINVFLGTGVRAVWVRCFCVSFFRYIATTF